jgi:hypothetical protein
MTAAVERPEEEGWRLEGSAEYGFLFVRRETEPRLLMLTPRDPQNATLKSFSPLRAWGWYEPWTCEGDWELRKWMTLFPTLAVEVLRMVIFEVQMGIEQQLKVLEKRRKRGMRLLAEGLWPAEVARRVGVTRQSVLRWTKLGGHAASDRNQGRGADRGRYH